jgi:hypothetical protein
MDVLARLVFRPLTTSSLTCPALFRTLHTRGGVVLYDEAERLRQTNAPEVSELVSMFLAGYRCGGCATRLEPVGDSYKLVGYQVFGPKALAGISGLPSVLASRCIPVAMLRASGAPATRRQIDADPAGWQRLRDDLHTLALSCTGQWPLMAASEVGGPAAPAAAGMVPLVPAEIRDRDNELWQPILALAKWVELRGVAGLHKQLCGHAVASVKSAAAEVVPEADEILIDHLAEAVTRNNTPTSSDLLESAQRPPGRPPAPALGDSPWRRPQSRSCIRRWRGSSHRSRRGTDGTGSARPSRRSWMRSRR